MPAAIVGGGALAPVPPRAAPGGPGRGREPERGAGAGRRVPRLRRRAGPRRLAARAATCGRWPSPSTSCWCCLGALITYLVVPQPTGSGTVARRSAWSAALGFFAAVPIAYLVMVVAIQIVRPCSGDRTHRCVRCPRYPTSPSVPIRCTLRAIFSVIPGIRTQNHPRSRNRVSIDEQHVAMPKLYGAPAYARPPAPAEPGPPLRSGRAAARGQPTDEEREFGRAAGAGLRTRRRGSRRRRQSERARAGPRPRAFSLRG